MKILTISQSPYLYTSNAKLNASILEYFYNKNHQVSTLVFNHDTNYFIPEEIDGKKCFFYQNGTIKIPLNVIHHQDISIQVYEVINKLKPDIVFTIGDHTEFLFMKAVKMFSDPFKWIAVMNNYSFPINKNNVEILSYIDGVFCTGFDSYVEFSQIRSGITDWQYVGSNYEPISYKTKNTGYFRVMVSGKNHQTENMINVIQAVEKCEKDDVKLYIHSDINSVGDYDFEVIKERFDPDKKFLSFPEKFVSIYDAYSDRHYKAELLTSQLFISVPMLASSAMGVFDALSQGCLPLMSNNAIHCDIATQLAKYLKVSSALFLVPSRKLMTTGEIYLNICDYFDIKKKIEGISKYLKDVYLEEISEFLNKNNRKVFLEKLDNMTDKVYSLESDTLKLEAV